MKNILWLATGGTISCIKGKNGLSPAAEINQMKKMLDVTAPVDCGVSIKCIMNIDSSNISCSDMKKIGMEANCGIKKGADGVVITHGTDTMAYTAAVLTHMLINSPVPVILTGAQRPFFFDNSDGVQNLANAFSAACDARFRGVYLLFGDKVIFGDKAYKAYTESDNAFISSGDYAAVIKNGSFEDVKSSDTVGEYSFCDSFCEEILLIKLTPCTRADIFGYAVDSGYKGIVIEGYGMGGIPDRLISSIKKAAESGIKIIYTSQCLFEKVSLDVYEVGINASGCGVVSGGNMTAEAAAAKLMFSF